MDILYRLKAPIDLTDLSDSINDSKSNGLYFDITGLIIDNSSEDKKIQNKTKKSIKYLKAVKSFKKNILFYFNYDKFFSRPIYFSPKIEKDQIIKQKLKLQKKEISKKEYESKLEDYTNYLKKNEERIAEMKKFCDDDYFDEKFLELYDICCNCRDILLEEDEFDIFDDREKMEIIGWEIPQITNFPIKEQNDPYFREIQKFIEEINQKCLRFSKDISEFEMIYPITLMLEDLSTKNKRFHKHLLNSEEFQKTIIWIIDSNELYQSKVQKAIYFNFLKQFENKEENQTFVKYYGIKQYYEFKQNIENLNIIFREDAYSSYNVNIKRHANPYRSRDLLDINNLKHKNENDILKITGNNSFNCNCSICRELNIKTYKDVQYFYFSDKLSDDPQFEAKFLPKREVKNLEEYKNKKLRRYQTQMRKIHNFETLDSVVFMDYDLFSRIYGDLIKW